MLAQSFFNLFNIVALEKNLMDFLVTHLICCPLERYNGKLGKPKLYFCCQSVKLSINTCERKLQKNFFVASFV